MSLDANWGQKVTPVPSIHTPPAKFSGAQLPGQSQLEQWGLGFIDGIVEKVVLAIVGVVVPGPLVDQLQHWAQILLPAQILQPLQDLVGFLVDLLGPIPIVGTIAHTLASYFGLLKDKGDVAQETGENAQVSADHANVSVAQLAAQVAAGNVPSGVVFSDTFNRPDTGSLGSDYAQSSSGAGGGALHTDGNNAVYDPTGSGVGRRDARCTTALFTDYQSAACVQNEAIANILTPPSFFLILRADIALMNYVVATIGNNLREIGKVVGGSYTALWSAAGDNAPGDRWTLKAGTTTDVYELLLFRNGDVDPVGRVTDTGTRHIVGSANRFGGFGVTSGLQYIPPFFTGQTQSPHIQSVDFNDRLAAA